MESFEIVKDRKNIRVTNRMEGIVLPKSVFKADITKQKKNVELAKKINDSDSESDSDTVTDTVVDTESDTDTPDTLSDPESDECSSSDDDSDHISSKRSVELSVKPSTKPSTKPLVKSTKKPIGKIPVNTSAKATNKSSSISSKKTTQDVEKKQIKSKAKINDKSKKQETVPDSDSESEIDVEDTYRVGSDSDDDLPKDKNKDKKSKVVVDDEYADTSKPPVYDGVEPYFLFKRRWDAFIQSKQCKRVHVTILEFLNKLLCTKYTSLRSIKKITFDMIPTPKKFTDMMTSDRDYIETFKIKYSQSIPTSKMIDNLLGKVNYSLVEVDTGKELYYAVKPRSVSSRSIA